MDEPSKWGGEKKIILMELFFTVWSGVATGRRWWKGNRFSSFIDAPADVVATSSTFDFGSSRTLILFFYFIRFNQHLLNIYCCDDIRS